MDRAHNGGLSLIITSLTLFLDNAPTFTFNRWQHIEEYGSDLYTPPSTVIDITFSCTPHELDADTFDPSTASLSIYIFIYLSFVSIYHLSSRLFPWPKFYFFYFLFTLKGRPETETSPHQNNQGQNRVLKKPVCAIIFYILQNMMRISSEKVKRTTTDKKQ